MPTSCLLDVLAEMIPAEDILDSPYWSDSEEDDAGLFALERPNQFFADRDDDIHSQVEDSEAEELAKLEAEYEELVKLNERTKRFGSPAKGRHSSDFAPVPKARRSFKHLPVNEAGQVEFPVVLGRGPNRISISKIGPVVAIKGNENGLPLDFECRRKYADYDQTEDLFNSEAKKFAYYTCCVTGLEADKVPTFKIAMSDREFTIENTDAEALWHQFRSSFPPFLQPHLDEDFASYRVFFGLEHENLAKYFKEQLAAHSNQ